MGNIVWELKKLKVTDSTALEARNKSVEQEVADLKVELAFRSDELEDVKTKLASLERVEKLLGASRDVHNKAHLFNNDVKTAGEVSTTKIIPILVTFVRKMETVLVNIEKLVSGTIEGKSSRPLMAAPKETPRKGKPLKEIKTPLPPQRPGKE